MGEFWLYSILILVSDNLKEMKIWTLLCKNLELPREFQNVLYNIADFDQWW